MSQQITTKKNYLTKNFPITSTYIQDITNCNCWPLLNMILFLDIKSVKSDLFILNIIKTVEKIEKSNKLMGLKKIFNSRWLRFLPQCHDVRIS